MPTLTTEPDRVLVPVTSPLLPQDTCDATASGTETAVYRLVDGTGRVIDLCAHHFQQHEAALFLGGYAVAGDNSGILTSNYKGQAGE
jgi:hypothetical protein